jgi:hypothetical protein
MLGGPKANPMTYPALQLLRFPALREATFAAPPASVILYLREAVAASQEQPVSLVAEFTETVFRISDAPKWFGRRYLGVLRGSIVPAGTGSRVSVAADIGWRVRLILRFWAAMSVLLVAGGLVLSVAALVSGDPVSAAVAFLLPVAVVAAVWWSWRWYAERGLALEEWLIGILARNDPIAERRS